MYEQDQKLPSDQQYIWHLQIEGEIHLAMTMNPILAALIHNALYLVGDYTFKQVQGNLDECEFVVWNHATNECECESVLLSNLVLQAELRGRSLLE